MMYDTTALARAVVAQLRYESKIARALEHSYPIREDVLAPRDKYKDMHSGAFHAPQYDIPNDVVSVLVGWFRSKNASGNTQWGPSDQRDIDALATIADLSAWYNAEGREKNQVWHAIMRSVLENLGLL